MAATSRALIVTVTVTGALSAAAAFEAAVGCSRPQQPSVPTDSTNPIPALTPPQPGMTTWPAAGSAPIVAAAGDIAASNGHQLDTAALLTDLIRADRITAILALGDNAYPTGTAEDYQQWYGPTWGAPALKAITRPVPGNHEYRSDPGDATAYFDYFNGKGAADGPAGHRGEGWYSFDIGDWHLVALNTSEDCVDVPCDPASAQVAWLAADLAAHPARCTLAFFHAPRFQQGTWHGDLAGAAPLWNVLLDAGADVVLAGHEHNYQQFAPMNADGERDDARGIRSFVVGSGGAPLYELPSPADAPHADAFEAGDTSHWGVLELALHPDSYDWRFVSIDHRVLHAGSSPCH